MGEGIIRLFGVVARLSYNSRGIRGDDRFLLEIIEHERPVASTNVETCLVLCRTGWIDLNIRIVIASARSLTIDRVADVVVRVDLLRVLEDVLLVL